MLTARHDMWGSRIITSFAIRRGDQRLKEHTPDVAFALWQVHAS